MLLPILIVAPLLADAVTNTTAAAGMYSSPISYPALLAEDQKAADAAAGGPPKWTGSVNVGASYSDGNTDSRSVNAALDAVRRADDDRWTVKGYWNYGESRDDGTGELGITDRRAGASLKYDYFLSKKLYVFGIAAIETDLLADIDERYYAGPGVGYQWRESDEFKWGSEAGVTYFNTNYGHSDDKEYIAARIANNITWVINENTTFENTAEVLPSLEDSDDFYGKSDTKLKVALSKAMFAQLQWVYQFTNEPADGKERNDNLVVLGVGWKF
jgi:putative salt-induced outer membrane protein YdiY